MKVTTTLAAIFLANTIPAQAADWSVAPVQPAPTTIVTETQTPGGGLPDGLIATHAGGDIIAAWYDEPTTRYRHGIMGDAIEAGTLVAKGPKGGEYRLDLPQSEVFEDRYPRLADLDGDGTMEVITIRSSNRAGAAVTIYGLQNGRLVERATTDFIGRANRWLNIAGIAPFLDNDRLQIAHVTTPHIGGTLKLIGFENGKLSFHGDAYGFSNHWIGSRELRLSATMVVGGQLALALPAADRGSLRVMVFAEDGPKQITAVPLPGQIDKAIGRTALGFVVGLSNGAVLTVEPPE